MQPLPPAAPSPKAALLRLLNLLDMSLIMSAVDVDLREMLEAMRPAVADDLQAARDLSSQL